MVTNYLDVYEVLREYGTPDILDDNFSTVDIELFVRKGKVDPTLTFIMHARPQINEVIINWLCENVDKWWLVDGSEVVLYSEDSWRFLKWLEEYELGAQND